MSTVESENACSVPDKNWTKYLFDRDNELHQRIVQLRQRLKNYPKYSIDELATAGFEYTDDGKTIICHRCNAEVKEKIEGINLYKYHYEKNANCPFIRSMEAKRHSTTTYREQSPKRQKTEFGWTSHSSKNRFSESKLVQEARARSFSHWSKNVRPTKEQMMAAGFFQCNVGDRVICLYCNLIAQQWRGDIDDPSHVHSTLSPNCCYVQALLIPGEFSSVCIVNESLTANIGMSAINNPLSSDQIVYTSAVHSKYATVPSREATFATWNTDSLPAVNDLVQAGFFYIGTKTITTCFYCGGSLQNWAKTDKPIVEHIRWFSMCKYAKQLAGDELFNKIQEAKRARAVHEAAQTENNNTTMITTPINSQMPTSDERMLTRLVAARLDLPSSQRLLDKPFRLSVIKRCWEDQLRLKNDDFATDCDLYIACLILQKQIDHISGNKDNITIPSVKMREIQDGVPREIRSNKSVVEEKQLPTPITSIAEPMTVENNLGQNKAEETKTQTNVTLNNPCVLCWKEEKRLACIPCGHLVACSNCHQTLRTCPICRRGVEAFVRIYI